MVKLFFLFVKNIAKEREVASSGNEKPTHTFGPAEASSMDLEEILKQKTFTRLPFLKFVCLLLFAAFTAAWWCY